MINGVTQLFMTKSDVMSGFDTVKVCTSYRSGGKECREISVEDLQIEPVYRELPGWNENISLIREFRKLPQNLRKYIKFVEDQTGIPIRMVSVGPDREETILR
jgi:adenylosuccinate synthase